MRRAWTSWELRRQMVRNPRGKWMQSWMTVTLHQLLCAHREIGEIHLRRSCMRRGWRSLITEWSRRVREVKPTFSAIFKWLRPLEKSPEARQKMTDAPNKERALQRTLESSLRAKHERISAMVAAAAAKRAVEGLQAERAEHFTARYFTARHVPVPQARQRLRLRAGRCSSRRNGCLQSSFVKQPRSRTWGLAEDPLDARDDARLGAARCEERAREDARRGARHAGQHCEYDGARTRSRTNEEVEGLGERRT